jgi:hypothetical protein
MITRAQTLLAGMTLILIAGIVALVVIVSSNRSDDESGPHDLSRDLTAAAGRATPTPAP